MFLSLVQAAFGKFMKVIKILLARGAPVNLPGTSIRRPLHVGICDGHESAIRLLSRGANVETVDSQGHGPLVVATRRQNVNMVIALKRAEAGQTQYTK
ncbi:Ankyrin repeat and KH domain-containing protein [Echinococcus granulosus]|uniref:Ankyrin repeat and KH domain-containing protein n=1 Tax=Echinococcus granulosus TaxID=6210 RepID=W6TZA4_ECHGR|nr:Ankyrin repeat and KH domain-containing protein [Echinococcus granulosus]EUB54130.1 Ankyrin repeat and KH domain-containing protein [Echinococcus granulosus]